MSVKSSFFTEWRWGGALENSSPFQCQLIFLEASKPVIVLTELVWSGLGPGGSISGLLGKEG